MESVKFAAPVDTAEDWKKKKNYKPAALFTVLLLGTAFLAGKSYGYGRNSNDPTQASEQYALQNIAYYSCC